MILNFAAVTFCTVTLKCDFWKRFVHHNGKWRLLISSSDVKDVSVWRLQQLMIVLSKTRSIKMTYYWIYNHEPLMSEATGLPTVLHATIKLHSGVKHKTGWPTLGSPPTLESPPTLSCPTSLGSSSQDSKSWRARISRVPLVFPFNDSDYFSLKEIIRLRKTLTLVYFTLPTYLLLLLVVPTYTYVHPLNVSTYMHVHPLNVITYKNVRTLNVDLGKNM